MRCFLAVDIPQSVKEKLTEVQKELKGLDTKLVEEESMHFTLKFLGEIDEGKMKEVVKRLGEIRMMPFKVDLRDIGFFPSSSFIRVVWIGSLSKEFLDLHQAVNDTLAELFPMEKPVPHLTLARVKSQAYRKELLEFCNRHSKEEFGSFMVDKIKLKKSTLSRGGPVYEDLEEFELMK